MKVSFITLGCKVNSYESDAISALFTAYGDEVINDIENSDCIIINTCTVTNQASAKSRKMIRGAIKKNPNAIIAVMGCYSQTFTEEVKAIKGVNFILGNVNKSEIVDLVHQEFDKNQTINKVKEILKYKEFENLNPVNFSHTRAFLKIEDGCNNFCSYCIIPFARGPIRSKNSDDVINDINKIVNNGYKEIVLTGIHTGKYKDGNTTFTELVKRILNETKLKRLRISSIEINEITDEFIELMKTSDVIAKHLHLPLQAGSNDVLKKMNRHYDKDEFINRVKYIQSEVPGISITTDIIVGFPEETEDNFSDTINTSKEIGFAKIHCFPFSLREGTKACELKEIKDSIKEERQQRLLALDDELESSYKNRFVGTIQEIIIEDKHGDYLLGHSSNYLPIFVPYEDDLYGKMVKVIIESYENDKIIGKII